DAEFLEEHGAQQRIVVLPGVDEPVCAQRIELRDDAAQADDLRPRADNREDLHVRAARHALSSAGSGASRYGASSSRSPSWSRVMSDDEYSALSTPPLVIS